MLGERKEGTRCAHRYFFVVFIALECTYIYAVFVFLSFSAFACFLSVAFGRREAQQRLRLVWGRGDRTLPYPSSASKRLFSMSREKKKATTKEREEGRGYSVQIFPLFPFFTSLKKKPLFHAPLFFSSFCRRDKSSKCWSTRIQSGRWRVCWEKRKSGKLVFACSRKRASSFFFSFSLSLLHTALQNPIHSAFFIVFYFFLSFFLSVFFFLV